MINCTPQRVLFDKELAEQSKFGVTVFHNVGELKRKMAYDEDR